MIQVIQVILRIQKNRPDNKAVREKASLSAAFSVFGVEFEFNLYSVGPSCKL